MISFLKGFLLGLVVLLLILLQFMPWALGQCYGEGWYLLWFVTIPIFVGAGVAWVDSI